MRRLPILAAVFLAACVIWMGGGNAAAARSADVLRTVYFSAVDDKGAPITDLAATDLTVKEGGKDRVIAGLRPAPVPLQVSLLVDDAGSGAFRAPVAQFLQRVAGRAHIAIRVLSPQPVKVADFGAGAEGFNAALSRIGPRGRVSPDTEQIIEAVGDAAKELQERHSARRAIVVLTVHGEKTTSDLADDALKALKNSGASLSVVSITGADAGKVLGDGPRQSGGTTLEVSGNSPLAGVLSQIADNLQHHYELTYNLPDGVKPNDRLSLSTSRKGVKLLAPSKIPDK
jgi:hypothetical protein